MAIWLITNTYLLVNCLMTCLQRSTMKLLLCYYSKVAKECIRYLTSCWIGQLHPPWHQKRVQTPPSDKSFRSRLCTLHLRSYTRLWRKWSLRRVNLSKWATRREIWRNWVHWNSTDHCCLHPWSICLIFSSKPIQNSRPSWKSSHSLSISIIISHPIALLKLRVLHLRPESAA